MVNIQFIKTTQCPVCGCDTVVGEAVEVDRLGANRKIRRHCNGTTWETREFACGYSTACIPNFDCEEERGKCGLGLEEAKRKAAEAEAKVKILHEIETCLCTDNYKKKMKSALEYI